MCVCSVFYAFVVFVHGARVHIFFPTPHAELVNFNPPDKGGGVPDTAPSLYDSTITT